MAGKVNRTNIKAPAVPSRPFLEPEYAPGGVAPFPKKGSTKSSKKKGK
jgi:hypothetical protein